MSCKNIWALVTVITTFILVSSTRAAFKLTPHSTQLKRSLNSQLPVEETKKQISKILGASENEKSSNENGIRQWQSRQIQNLNISNPFGSLFGNASNLTTNLGSAGSAAIITLAGLPLIKGLAKASLLSLPFQIKELLLRPLILVALLLFLITGAAYFACNVVNCQTLIGGLGDIGGSGSTSYRHRNDENFEFLYENTLRPILKALENGYKKYK